MNNITIVGRLTKDIDLKKGAKSSFGLFSIADRKDKDNTRFFNCTAFGKLAEVMEQYAHKGDKIAIQGELDTTTKDNVTYYNILVNNFEFCESKKN